MFADILSLVELPIFPNSIRLRVLFHYFSDVATFQTKTSQFSLPLKWMHTIFIRRINRNATKLLCKFVVEYVCSYVNDPGLWICLKIQSKTFRFFIEK